MQIYFTTINFESEISLSKTTHQSDIKMSFLMLTLFAAVFVSLRSILMVDLLGATDLSNEFGLVIMFQGLSAFAGPPFAGIRDVGTVRIWQNGGICFYLVKSVFLARYTFYK